MDYELNTASWIKTTFHQLLKYHDEMARGYESAMASEGTDLPADWHNYHDARCRAIVVINNLTYNELDFEKTLLVMPAIAVVVVYETLLALVMSVYSAPLALRAFIPVTDADLAALHHRIIKHSPQSDLYNTDARVDYDEEGERRLPRLQMDRFLVVFKQIIGPEFRYCLEKKAVFMLNFMWANPRSPPPVYRELELEPPPPYSETES